MRPIASTWVASMQNIAAPDSASVLMCVKCQSLASPLTAEYWHIGATMMRLGSARPRSLIWENRALMRGCPRDGRNCWFYLARRCPFLNHSSVGFEVQPTQSRSVFIVIARSVATKQSRVIMPCDGLLRYARNDGLRSLGT